MGTKERQDRERQAVTASILSAARDLFVAEGYQSVSIRKIAERIEYSPPPSTAAPWQGRHLPRARCGRFHLLDEKVQSAMKTDSPLENARLLVGLLRILPGAPRVLPAHVRRSVRAAHHAGVGRLRVPAADAQQRGHRDQKAIDAGSFPKTLSPNAAMHMLWASLIGPAVVGIRHRLATGEGTTLARDVLNAPSPASRPVLPHVRIVQVPGRRYRGTPVPAGVRRHELE
jgi:hypothetical protein